jgi:O-antigen ligase
VISWLRAKLGLPETTSAALTLCTFWYCYHLLSSGWVAGSELSVFLAMCCFAVALWRHDIAVRFHILWYPLFLYALMSTISSFAAGRHLHAFGEQALWIKMLLFPMALTLFREIPRTRTLALNSILIFGAFSALFGFAQYFFLGRRDLEHRITGPTAHVMTLSGLLLPIALAFLILWFHDRRNPWLIGGAVLTNIALLMTYTRSIWLGWLVAVFALLLLKKPRWMVYAAPLLVLFVTFAPMSLFSRMASTFDTRQSSNFDRIRMLQGGIEIIRDYPLLGVGPANVKEVYPLYRKPDAPRFRIPHLHNNIVQIWAERGIVALVAYFLLLILFLRECARGWRGPAAKYAEIGVAVTVGLTYAGLFEFNFGDTEVFWLLLDVFALVVAFVETAPANEPLPEPVPVSL